jgi:hypothetical protein
MLNQSAAFSLSSDNYIIFVRKYMCFMCATARMCISDVRLKYFDYERRFKDVISPSLVEGKTVSRAVLISNNKA